MAVDEAMLDVMRADLGLLPGLEEKRMFGGVAFMLGGHMVCGIGKDRAMYRVGKAREAEALEAGAEPMSFTGRRMGGMVELDAGAFEEEALRARLTAMALDHAASLPPKS
ncbi:MAG: hypothetical protein D6832_03845 [Alphaproteobacteria bacterium]|nr:MAG: hypothetical protein D6832_03845 [Alphaproteobacteria bacterium]